MKPNEITAYAWGFHDGKEARAKGQLARPPVKGFEREYRRGYIAALNA